MIGIVCLLGDIYVLECNALHIADNQVQALQLVSNLSWLKYEYLCFSMLAGAPHGARAPKAGTAQVAAS